MSGGADAQCRALLEIQNRLGLHARAAVQLVKTASLFESDVWIMKDGERVSGRSIMGVMTLAAAQGSRIEVETHGPDAAAALDAIRSLVDARFNEDE